MSPLVFCGGRARPLTGCSATLSPLIATQLISAQKPWYTFYWTLVGGALLELVTSTAAFWTATAQEYRDHNARVGEGDEKSRTWEAAKSPITWLMSAFLFIYMGVEGKSKRVTSPVDTDLSQSVRRWVDCGFYDSCPPWRRV